MAAVIRRENVHHYMLAFLVLIAMVIALSFLHTHRPESRVLRPTPAPAAAP